MPRWRGSESRFLWIYCIAAEIVLRESDKLSARNNYGGNDTASDLLKMELDNPRFRKVLEKCFTFNIYVDYCKGFSLIDDTEEYG